MAERGSSTPTLDEGRTASPAISLEEVPAPKKRKIGPKGRRRWALTFGLMLRSL